MFHKRFLVRQILINTSFLGADVQIACVESLYPVDLAQRHLRRRR